VFEKGLQLGRGDVLDDGNRKDNVEIIRREVSGIFPEKDPDVLHLVDFNLCAGASVGAFKFFYIEARVSGGELCEKTRIAAADLGDSFSLSVSKVVIYGKVLNGFEVEVSRLADLSVQLAVPSVP
ncbi:MAG: hypothetical protein RIE56_13925, partial [Amphiplicatus sp.]